ncbi:tRNA (adenosine(37)-N6)-threonylcarbamoyltransferase complex dimerization subunit type 1 TsaB [Halothiobacillus sp. DCM-1]|uniref:tRNA (adenosine(37)-N6)-threonylcarbamoyltransferase complex dimerization subunit type 1 TsaB n=1 Tax=Halothiobacillus sp. DCM-1 TaxID=3112558 RepID=UPI0032436536
MILLYLDTATEACSVGVWQNGQVLSRFEYAPRAHTQLLLPMAQAVLQEAGLSLEALDGIAFNRGPGSFTGVRIAVAAALGMAMGLGCPVLGVSSLTALAQSRYESMAEGERIHAAIDARMGEVYHGAFERRAGRLRAVTDEQVIAPAALIAQWQHLSWLGAASAVGTGFGRYPELAAARGWREILPEQLPDARFGVALAAQVPLQDWYPPEKATPVYLRDEVATPKGA